MKLPVLMYHKVDDNSAPDYLTLSTKKLEQQFKYLNKKGYTSILLSDLINYVTHKKPLPQKSVLITFDDGFKNNFTHLYPLLLQYNFKANIFLVADFIGTPNYLSVEEIKNMNLQTVEFGLHTEDHKNYNDHSLTEIDSDIKNCKEKLNLLSIPFQPCFAYTFGAYPKKDQQKREAMFNILDNNKIDLAFRIGNRINHLPLKNKHLIQRIDIRGDESFLKFKIGLHFGKKILLK